MQCISFYGDLIKNGALSLVLCATIGIWLDQFVYKVHDPPIIGVCMVLWYVSIVCIHVYRLSRLCLNGHLVIYFRYIFCTLSKVPLYILYMHRNIILYQGPR